MNHWPFLILAAGFVLYAVVLTVRFVKGLNQNRAEYDRRLCDVECEYNAALEDERSAHKMWEVILWALIFMLLIALAWATKDKA